MNDNSVMKKKHALCILFPRTVEIHIQTTPLALAVCKRSFPKSYVEIKKATCTYFTSVITNQSMHACNALTHEHKMVSR